MRKLIVPMCLFAAALANSVAWAQQPTHGRATVTPTPPMGYYRTVAEPPMQTPTAPQATATPTPPTATPAAGESHEAPAHQYRFTPSTSAPVYSYADCSNGDCGGCSSCKEPCEVQWFIPWTCDDLKMEKVECDPCANRSLFWCPDEEEEEECDACKEKGTWTQTDKGLVFTPAEEEEEEEEDDAPSTPLMKWIYCLKQDGSDCQGCKKHDECGLNVYGWVQGGFTANFDSPRDRINVGTGYNYRSNDFLLNQAWIVFEDELEHDDEFNFGYRVDTMIGTDAPFNVQQGLFDDIIGTGQVGNRIGFDMPQFYVEAHLPGMFGGNGMDIKFGKWFTLVNYEVIAAPGNFFYSKTYNFFAGPFNNTGGLATFHLTDTLDFMVGTYVGWEKFEDNNTAWSYTAALAYTSCDERFSWVTAMQTGPEQDNNDDNYRTQVSSYITSVFGDCNEWTGIVGGSYAIDKSAIAPGQDARWYATTAYLLYTINPKLHVGARGEFFRDEQGYRVGYPGSFYETTFGFNYFPYQNLRVRPELRFDWASEGTPFNDQTDSMQTTAAIDFIYEF